MAGTSGTRNETCLVIGIGNRFRGDDAVGLLVADRLVESAIPGVRVLRIEGGLLSLLDAWSDAECVVVIDATRTGMATGAIRRIDATHVPLPTCASTSTHGTGLAEVVELAKTVDRMPGRLVVYGIEVGRVDRGDELSDACAEAIDAVVEAVRKEIACMNSA